MRRFKCAQLVRFDLDQLSENQYQFRKGSTIIQPFLVLLRPQFVPAPTSKFLVSSWRCIVVGSAMHVGVVAVAAIRFKKIKSNWKVIYDRILLVCCLSWGVLSLSTFSVKWCFLVLLLVITVILVFCTYICNTPQSLNSYV